MQNVQKLNPRHFLSFHFETENLRHLFQNIRKMASTSGSGSHAGKANRLINEKSPYLLQHAHNPVDWYPWGDEAFEKAKKENKMIFLSVGYSTCHWCHVMERESFENEEIGKIMNENFVSIKVDREERPDVDKMYMGFVQATTGSGGWPMSVWLTPDLKPVVGGTYFAPKASFGRPGFATVLEHIAGKWRENNQAVREQGSKLLEAISQVTKRTRSNPQVLENVQQCAKGCQNHYAESYDPDWGGFGDAPKFPQPSNFDFLLRYYAHFEAKQGSWDKSDTLKMVAFTLKQMARGGIHDHIAQGFHRYSTDEKWHVPHFEKMLYDQGQLAVVYADMFQITKNEFYANIVGDILTYVDRDLSNKEGGFYSAEDADSYPKFGDREKKEGAFCVWTHHEIQKLLNHPIGPDKKVSLADVFCKYYLVKPDGNVGPYQDPHQELTNQNVLIALHSYEKVAEEFKLDVPTVKNGLKEAQKILFEARLKRPKPHLDTKILTAWNGLMISGFAKAAVALENPEYGSRAEKAIKFIRRHLYDEKCNSLLRSCYADDKGNVVQISNPIQAFADDYAFFVAALLDFYDYCHDDQWLKWAGDLVAKMDELFWDKENNAGYFQCSTEDKSILVRQKEDQDGAEPSSNSVMALNLIRLYNLLDKETYKERAKKIFAAYGNTLRTLPFALPKMMCALLAINCPPTQIVIVGDKTDSEVKEMLNVIHSRFMPFAVTIVLNDATDKWLLSQNDHLKSLQEVNKKPTVFVCSNFSCQLPVHTAKDLEKMLEK